MCTMLTSLLSSTEQFHFYPAMQTTAQSFCRCDSYSASKKRQTVREAWFLVKTLLQMPFFGMFCEGWGKLLQNPMLINIEKTQVDNQCHPTINVTH